MSKRYCAVFCVDENHLFQNLTEISITSFRESCKDVESDVVVLTNDMNCKVRGGDKVVQIGGVLEKYGFTKDRIAGTRFGKLFGIMTWAKMLLPFVEELKSYDRVVAIDPDIIITDGRIAEFFTDDMEGHLFMGVPDCGNSKVVPRMRNDVARSEICGKWEWNARLASNEMIEHYCNAGLFALDMKSLTESEARLAEYEESVGFASHHLRNVGFGLVDQDWLNYMYEFKTKPRKYMWFYNGENAVEMAEAMALHFVTRRGKAAMVSYVMTGKFQDNFTKAEKRQD